MNTSESLRQALNDAVRYFTTSSIDLSANRIVEIQSLRNEFDRNCSYIELNHVEKLRNRLELATLDYCIVSMGQNCLPRTLSTRWGLKKTNAEGELTGPFDLAIHPLAAVRRILEDEFEHYIDPKYFELSAQNIPSHTRYGAIFNHEQSHEFTKDNFARLRKTYEARIENFYRMVKDRKNLLFVINISEISQGHSLEVLRSDIEAIIQILKDMASGTCQFLLLDTRFESDGRALSKDLGSTPYFRISKPYKSYIWYQAGHFSSARGVAFEQEIVSAIKSVLLLSFSKNT